MKKIIFAEDPALKIAVQEFVKKCHLDLSVRTPNQGGWTQVLDSVERLARIGSSAVGIVDGDVRDEALKSAEEKGIAERIYPISKKDIERYFFEKPEIWEKSGKPMPAMPSFDECKRLLNEDEGLLRRLSHILVLEKCKELEDLQKFIFA